MIEISTTATFDRLFKKLPKTAQHKTAIKDGTFQRQFHLEELVHKKPRLSGDPLFDCAV